MKKEIQEEAMLVQETQQALEADGSGYAENTFLPMYEILKKTKQKTPKEYIYSCIYLLFWA